MSLPLEGVRVLDLTRALAGPFCSMILGDLGADVVKVEPTPKGEMIRGWGPFIDDVSTYYLSVNRNKRSLALNFRDPKAIDLIRDLSDSADILVENFKPGVMEEMGLGYAELRKHNPKLIYAGITGFGRNGPYGEWPGLDQIAQGMSGLMSITGPKGEEPTRVGVPIGDLIAGMWAAIGVQGALVQRHASGRGQRVETSLLAGLVGILCVQGQRYLSLGDVPKPAGNNHPVICPYGTFQAADGPFNMAAVTDEMWARLCKLLGLEALIHDPKYNDNSRRMANRDELTLRLNEALSAKKRMEWIPDLVKEGIPAGPIYDMAEVFDDPHIVHCGMVEEIEHPQLGLIRQLANPVRLDTMEGRSVRLPPPLLGEHSEAILRDWGLSDARISSAIRDGIVITTKMEEE